MILGVLLAGGQSRRMGRDKASLVVDGTTLAERALSTLRAVCDDVVILGHGRGCPSYIRKIPDHGLGPARALQALMSEAADLFVILPVDMPLIGATHLKTLIAAIGDRRAACFEDAPLPLVLKPGPLLDADRLTAVVAALDPQRAPAPDPEILHNVNTDDDLRRLSRG